jgi:hypothetical protein
MVEVGLGPSGEVRVVLPAAAFGAVAVDSNAVDTSGAGVYAFVVAGSEGVSIRVHPDRSVRARPWWSGPERRLALDLRPEESGSPVPRLVVGDGVVHVVLAWPVSPVDEPIVMPVEISGYGRLIFEGQGVIRVRTLSDTVGGGELVAVTLTGEVIFPTSGLEYGIQLNAGPDAWSEFRFTMGGLSPGDYELFIGDDVALGESDISMERGAYDTFTVAAR